MTKFVDQGLDMPVLIEIHRADRKGCEIRTVGQIERTAWDRLDDDAREAIAEAFDPLGCKSYALVHDAPDA